MKGRVIVLTQSPCHAALVVDGQVEDLLMDPGDALGVGDVRMAEVLRKLPNDGAAFVDLEGIRGYLRDAKGLKSGDRLPVMVTGQPDPGKAIPVYPGYIHQYTK